MNPAFENFLNNMSRLGGTPRETTRRVSASSFLGKDIDIERRVNNNSKKISIIARILKSRRANTAGIEKSIFDIKNTMSSIVQTLEAQEKFEYEKFLETQQQLENEKRRKRETATEKDKPVVDFFKKQVERVVAPVRNGFLHKWIHRKILSTHTRRNNCCWIRNCFPSRKDDWSYWHIKNSCCYFRICNAGRISYNCWCNGIKKINTKFQ